MLNRSHSEDSYIRKIDSENADFNFVEAFNTLAVNLKYSATDSNKIMFTSSSPSEGKTTISVNAAIALAKQGNRVLLIDCDLRKPKVRKFFEGLGKNGLTNYLIGDIKYEELIQKCDIDGLDIIVSGKIPPSPTRLLLSKEMGALLDKVTPLYDWIVFDTPPVNLVTDAVVLLKYDISTILIADQKEGNLQILSKAIDSLKFANAKILGIVVNNAPLEFRYGYASKYKYKYKYYSYK